MTSFNKIIVQAVSNSNSHGLQVLFGPGSALTETFAHKSQIKGMVIGSVKNEHILFTGSKDGAIKAWKFLGQDGLPASKLE